MSHASRAKRPRTSRQAAVRIIPKMEAPQSRGLMFPHGRARLSICGRDSQLLFAEHRKAGLRETRYPNLRRGSRPYGFSKARHCAIRANGEYSVGGPSRCRQHAGKFRTPATGGYALHVAKEARSRSLFGFWRAKTNYLYTSPSSRRDALREFQWTCRPRLVQAPD